MSVHRKGSKWSVRYREAGSNRSRTSTAGKTPTDSTQRSRDAASSATWRHWTPAVNARRVRDRTGPPTYAITLAPKTRQHYANLYDFHLSPELGGLGLRDLRAERIARWQADRLAAGAGPVAFRQALDLLSSLLQRAVESERIATNPVRLVRRAPRPQREEVQPLAPATVETMRSAASPRDAMLLSVLAYAGLRPSEALALRPERRARTDVARSAGALAGRGRRHQDASAPHGAPARPRSARASSAGGAPRRETSSCSRATTAR